MDCMAECVDSPSSGNNSCSTLSSMCETPPRGLENLRRKLKLQHINSAKMSDDLQTEDGIGSGKTLKSSTFKKKFQDHYNAMEVIGQGACGVVKKIQCHEDDQIYVAKIVRGRDQEHIEQVKREFQILSKLQHRSIIRPKELIIDESIGTAHLILEYFPGQTLEDLIIERGRLDEDLVKHIIDQLLPALKHVHDKGVCHRDITASNILINENNEIKLIDFSVSKIFREDLWSPVNKASGLLRKKSSPLLPGYHNFMLSNTGASFYKAPEIVTSVPYNHSVDMWSLGVVTFYALVGYKPFHSKTLEKLYKKISNADYKWDPVLWADISYEAVLFVKSCLKQYPFIRLSTKEALYHPWIKGIKLDIEECRKERRPRTKCLSPPARTPPKDMSSKQRASFVLAVTAIN